MFLFSKQMFVEMFSEVITVFSQFRGNILTNLLWSFKLYQGAKLLLIELLCCNFRIKCLKISILFFHK